MKEVFQIVVLGCSGGPKEGNLSGYLFSPLDINEWYCLDAGCLLHGIDYALEKNNLATVPFQDPSLTHAGEMLTKHIRGFLISHAHLDHIAGLVFNSQVDEHKYIMGTDSTIDNIRDHIFNGKIWPNYGSEGEEPIVNRYSYIRLPLHEQVQLPNSTLRIEAHLLCHPKSYPSTAFLIEREGEYLLYFGDTSSDSLEKEPHLEHIWKRIAPLLQQNKLHGMFLECSYCHADADQAVYGHLDTKLMLHELHRLSEIADVSLEGFTVIVTHRKESLRKGVDTQAVIRDELIELNDLGINFVFPCQGDRITC
ncbi:MAG: hypothetical protein S4CHLAM123_15230 [Chlamydiales bacterium]|nr:hypothetical protein [Chlamydiales bacterium]